MEWQTAGNRTGGGGGVAQQAHSRRRAHGHWLPDCVCGTTRKKGLDANLRVLARHVHHAVRCAVLSRHRRLQWACTAVAAEVGERSFAH